MLNLKTFAVAMACVACAACSQSGSEDVPVTPSTPTTPPGQPAQAVPATPSEIEGPDPATMPKANVDGAAEPQAADTPATSPTAPAPTAAPSGDAPADTAGLAGTKWQVDDMQIEFKDDSTVFVNGGPISLATAGKGTNGTYKVENGQLQINALGQTKAGTWDGEKLEIGGTTAEKM